MEYNIKLGSNKILKQEDARIVRDSCNELEIDDIMWICKLEKDRELSLGIQYHTFDSYARANKSIQSERFKIFKFIETYRENEHPNLKEYVRSYSSMINQVMLAINKVNHHICKVLRDSVDGKTLMGVWSEFVPINEKDNAQQMYLSGDRWDTSAHLPTITNIVWTLMQKRDINNFQFAQKVAKYFFNSEKFPMKPNELTNSNSFLLLLVPLISVTDKIMKRSYQLASKCSNLSSHTSYENLITAYLNNKKFFKPLEQNGIVPIFCHNELQLSLPVEDELSLKKIITNLSYVGVPKETTFSYLQLKNLESEVDCFEYKGIFAFSAGLLYLRTFNEIKKISTSKAQQFYSKVRSDCFSDAYRIAKPCLIR